ncbi:hypothetical protein D3C76_1355920 [compost metagenome]
MTLQVHTHHRVPVIFRQAQKQPVTQHPGIVDQHVHLAERRQRGLDDALCMLQGSNVITVGDGLATRRQDLPNHIAGRFVTNIVDHDIRPLGSEGQRIGATEAATCTGDNYRTTVTHCHEALLGFTDVQ